MPDRTCRGWDSIIQQATDVTALEPAVAEARDRAVDRLEGEDRPVAAAAGPEERGWRPAVAGQVPEEPASPAAGRPSRGTADFAYFRA